MALKRLAVPGNPTVTRCRALELMDKFYLFRDASGQGFVLGLCYHEGLIFDSENWSKQWKNETSNWKEVTNITV